MSHADYGGAGSPSTAGVDVGKHRLDVASHWPAGIAADIRANDETAVDNAPDGIAAQLGLLTAREVRRAGADLVLQRRRPWQTRRAA